MLAAACATAQPGAAQVAYPVLFDSDLSPHAGAATLLTFQRAVAAGEDRLLVPRPITETSGARRAATFAYRAGKLALLDVPQDELISTINHELFGHGFRFREFELRGTRYVIKWPPPYGSGGGSAEYSTPDRELRAHELLAIDIAGIEGNTVAAEMLALRAIGRGAIHYREATAYLLAILDGFDYVMGAVDTTEVTGSDVDDFLVDLNTANRGFVEPLRARSLKRRAALALANPMIGYAAYGAFVQYIGLGRTSNGIRTIRINRDIRYLPWFSFQLTPYGTEWSSDHAFVHGDRVLYASLRRGDGRTMRTSAVELKALQLVTVGRVTLDAATQVWRQPVLSEIGAGTPPTARTGGLATATMRVRATRARSASLGSSVLIQLGVKSAGFARGERLRGGPILRIGFSFAEPDRR